MKNNRGQASLIILLVIAMAFIFYAIELNWGKISDWKLTTWMAAVSSSSQTASNYASYGERVLQENLLPSDPCDDHKEWDNGNVKCTQESFGLWLEILVIIIVVVIIIVTWGSTAWLLAVVVAVMLVIAMVIEYAVIRPMMFSIWNKLQQNLTISNQFQESGISTGLQMLATDTMTFPDRMDWDGNGRWGFKDPSTPKDKISRYGFFYTERLKFVKPPDDSAYEAFRQSLNNLVMNPYTAQPTTEIRGLGYDAYCTAENDRPSGAPQCYSQCTGPGARQSTGSESNIGLGWNNPTYNTTTTGNVLYVPLACNVACAGATCPPLTATSGARPLLYDPSLENMPVPYPTDFSDPTVASYRSRLGHDDEIGKSLNVTAAGAFDTTNAAIPLSGEDGYKPQNANGAVFPMLYTLGAINQGIALRLDKGLPNPKLSTIAQAKTTIKPTIDTTDALNATYKFWDTDNAHCAMDSSVDSKNGFFWKKGADRYCSGNENLYSESTKFTTIKPPAGGWSTVKHWPYYDCLYMYSGNTPIQCSSSPSKTLWPQDRLDSFVYQLSDLVSLNNLLANFDASTAASSAQQWYPKAAAFIAPQCSATGCANYATSCKAACKGSATCETSCNSECTPATYPGTTPISKFVATDPRMTALYSYVDDPTACNIKGQGYMIQWVYDLSNWADKIKKADRTGWLDQTFGNTTTDLCTGTLQNIVTCLNTNAKYYREMKACAAVFPKTPTPPYPDMPAACVDVIRLAQADATAATKSFFTHFSDYSSLITAPATTPTMPQATPVDDTLLLTTPYTTNVNTYAIISTWFNDNYALKEAIWLRYTAMKTLYTNALGSYSLFTQGATDFNNFLNGPALILMGARGTTAELAMKRLPSFAIYGWKDDKVYDASGVRKIGAWHLVRMEVKSPHIMPWIHSWEDVGFITTKTYYQFVEGNHDVVARATRWDENKTGGLARFNNGNPIWRFVWGNPSPADYTAITWPGATSDNIRDVNQGLNDARSDAGGALDRNCIGDTTRQKPWGLGIGITSETIEALQAYVPGTLPQIANTVPDGLERTPFGFENNGGAFMINIDPRVKIPRPQAYTGQCATAHPVPTSVSQYASLDATCKNDGYFDSCCAQGTYSYGGSRWGYLGSAYGSEYCINTNKIKCAQNIRGRDLYEMQQKELKCFSAADYLLNTGVKTTVAARYGVPQITYGSMAGPGPWHTQVHFYSPQDAQSGKTEYNFSPTHTETDTDIFN